MHVFVDSNIFLNFYHFSGPDLEALKELEELISTKQIVLLVTEQVIDECRRNRDAKITDAYKLFCNAKTEPAFPQISKSYPEYKQMKDFLKQVGNLKAILEAKMREDILNQSLLADTIINNLFRLAKVLKTDAVFDKAIKRYQIGNPPGKDHSYGDAINWECLLEGTPSKNDLHFLSDDKDFKSNFEETVFNPFLAQEWQDKKNSKIIFYTQLTEFLAAHYAYIDLQTEKMKDDYIQKLGNSSSFGETHFIVGILIELGEFSNTQANEILRVSAENRQVYSIIDDEDIQNFFVNLIKGKENKIDPQLLEKFKKILLPKIDYESEIKPEDLPF